MKARAKPSPSMVVQWSAQEGDRRERRRRGANMATTPGLMGVLPHPLLTPRPSPSPQVSPPEG